MYLDTDVIFAQLKENDWLQSEIEIESVENPITSAATAIEIQYVLQDDWHHVNLGKVHAKIEDEGIKLVPLEKQDLREAEFFRASSERVGVFDSIHLGVAAARNEPIVSTDTLFPELPSVEHIDPRQFGDR